MHPIIPIARGWLGTRFHHQGRVKKTATHRGGVDCLGLLVGVAQESGLPQFAAADEIDYSHQPDDARLKSVLCSLLTEIPPSGIAPGDIALFRIDGRAQHMGIITDIGLIHAYAPARAVVEHALDGWWRDRLVTAFRLPNCTDGAASLRGALATKQSSKSAMGAV